MITCPKCQKQLEDGTKFCDACGEKIVETVFCPNCGNATSTEFAFCQTCGAALDAAPAPETEAAPAKVAKKFPKKLLAIGAAALAAIVLIVVILAIALSGGKNNYVLYLKDGEVFFSQVSKLKPMQLTDKLYDGDVEDGTLINIARRNYDDIVMSKDGKNIFFGDEYEVDEYGNVNSFTLYYRSATNAKEEAVKLDSGVSNYVISENGKLVVYEKDGSLYQHDLKEKSKIASDFGTYKVTLDCKVVFWTNEDGDLYMQKSGQDKKKLDSEIYSIRHINEKGTAIWYSKNYDEKTGEYDLFKHNTKDKEKVASEVVSTFGFNDDGEFFYVKSESEEKTLYDMIDKDTSDASEYLVEALKAEKYNDVTKTLFFFDGKGGKTLSENYAGMEDYDGDANILIYSEAEEAKVKLSEIQYTGDVYTKLADVDEVYFVALGATVVEIDAEDAEDFTITKEGDAIYYMSDFTEVKKDATDEEKAAFVATGTLTKMTISGNKVKKTEQYDDDVYTYSIAKDGAVVCYKEYKRSKTDGDKTIPATYTLYVNKEKVADDVNSFTYNAETGAVAYITDRNTDPEKNCGTLNYWKNGKKTKISDDVYSYVFTPEGEVSYLKDYNTKKYRGDLFLFSGKKSVKVDEDVACILPVILWEDLMGV